MPDIQTSLCLNMIVKDEAARIKRCLASVRPYIRAYAILDTGSTDGTPALIERLLDGLPGEIMHGPFINFGDARNRALAWSETLPEEFGDYLLLLDADMELVVTDPECLNHLTAPAYTVVQKTTYEGLAYRNTRLLKRGTDARYVGVTHEYLDAPDRQPLDGLFFLDHADGANRPGKLQRDIDALEEELTRFPDEPRSVFYLAQSYRDLGDDAKALALYGQRIILGGWAEEVYVSAVNAARIMVRTGGSPVAAILGMCRQAIALLPQRAEARLVYTRACRSLEMWHEAFAMARESVGLPVPDGLFVEPWIYAWGMLDELAIAAYWAGDYATSWIAARLALTHEAMEPGTRRRLHGNLQFAADAIHQRRPPS